MDRTVKILLAIIAFSLVSLNMQLAGLSLVSEAKAEWERSDRRSITSSIDSVAVSCGSIGSSVERIARAIRNHN